MIEHLRIFAAQSEEIILRAEAGFAIQAATAVWRRAPRRVAALRATAVRVARF